MPCSQSCLVLSPSPGDTLFVHNGQHTLLCLNHSQCTYLCCARPCDGIHPYARFWTFLFSPFFSFSLTSKLVQKGLDNRESFFHITGLVAHLAVAALTGMPI